jgi:hypothetical protein
MQVSAIVDFLHKFCVLQSQRPRGLRRGCAAARKLVFRARIPLEQFVSCKCSVLSLRILYDWLITLPEESYRVWYV